MRAALFEEFQGPISVETVADPDCPSDGVVIKVGANGVCRSDWHGWMGHDSDVHPPHVPGHEMAGEIISVGPECREGWREGERVCVPFIVSCGTCGECRKGHQEVCERQAQPGFTYWGGFAEYCAVPRADVNLVRLPETLDFDAAASLGCRFTTSFRAIVGQGRITPGEWLAVHACGGIGQSAIMVAKAMGARVIGIDRNPEALAAATRLGADHVIDAGATNDVAEAVHDLTGGGADLSVDALGIEETCRNSILSLRRRGRHVQIGWMSGPEDNPKIPMAAVMGRELEIIGSHGMAGHRYPELLRMLETGALDPAALITRRVGLQEGADILMTMAEKPEPGIAVITEF